MMNRPILFLAFANDLDNYLPMVKRERKNIYRSLRYLHDNNVIRVETEAGASLEDIFEVFKEYGDQVVVFHFGGHAEGASLQLESMGNDVQKAYSKGLAQLLGQQKNLQLVFLNGCATRPQVESLLKNGVKTVIATHASIQDKMATEFAEQFYNALSSHATLLKSFQFAKAFIASKYQDFPEISVRRNIKFRSQDQEIPWGLYCASGDESLLNWTLPKKTRRSFVFRNRFDYVSKIDVNVILIETLCEEIANYNRNLDAQLDKDDLDLPSIKREIVDSFPTPIGEQLRKLFIHSYDPDNPEDMEQFSLTRLEQLLITYRSTTQFICYTLLSQLWDIKHNTPDFQISDDYIVGFNSFFSLSKENFKSFDFVKLITAITDLFDDHGIPYFINELKQVKINAEKNPELFAAYVFMNTLHQDLMERKIDSSQIEELCLEGEAQLGIILKELAFLTKYKLVTVKGIEIIKTKHKKARFRHNQILLNRALTVASTGVTEKGVEFDNYTDAKCVLFLKVKDRKVTDYLNLSPFIIDENALRGEHSSKLYLYAFMGKESFDYQFLNNVKDPPLVVSSENYPGIVEEFDRFKAQIFGMEYRPKQHGKTAGNRSRFNRNR